MNNPREFNKVFSAQFYNSNQGIKINNKNYFDGYPFLRDKKIKGISITTDTVQYVYAYLTIVDSNNNTVLYNVPFADLMLDIIQPKSKLRLYNINGINLLSSYWTSVVNKAGSNDLLFTINFYY